MAAGTEDAHGWSLPQGSSGAEGWELALLAVSLERAKEICTVK